MTPSVFNAYKEELIELFKKTPNLREQYIQAEFEIILNECGSNLIHKTVLDTIALNQVLTQWDFTNNSKLCALNNSNLQKNSF
jgi:hypothetical protein